MINRIVLNEIGQDNTINREYILTDIPLHFRHSVRLFAAEDTICNEVETGDKSDDGLLPTGARSWANPGVSLGVRMRHGAALETINLSG